MEVIFLGKNKPSVIKALQFLLDAKISVKAIISGTSQNNKDFESGLLKTAKKYNIPFMSDSQLNSILEDKQGLGDNFKEIDLVISYLYPKKITSILSSILSYF